MDSASSPSGCVNPPKRCERIVSAGERGRPGKWDAQTKEGSLTRIVFAGTTNGSREHVCARGHCPMQRRGSRVLEPVGEETSCMSIATTARARPDLKSRQIRADRGESLEGVQHLGLVLGEMPDDHVRVADVS